MRPAPGGVSNPTLVAYMENDSMEYVQYLYKDKAGKYYAVRVGRKGSTPVTIPMTKEEAQVCLAVMSVKLGTI